MDELLTKYLSTNKQTDDNEAAVNDPLFSKYLSTNKAADTNSEQQPSELAGVSPEITAGVGKGIMDVANTIGGMRVKATQGVGRLIKAATGIKTDTERQPEELQQSIDQQNQEYQNKYGDSTLASIGRAGGQMAATAPLTPVRGFQAVRGVMGALPTVLSTGEKVAAPLTNRLLASSAVGGLAGAEFGALTSSSNKEGLPYNVGMGAAGGAIGGPIVEGGGALAAKGVNAVRSAIGTAAVNTFAGKYGITVNSARRLLSELENEGMSLAEAETAIAKLGPNATLADLTPGLQRFAGALAQRGGRTTATVANRFEMRAQQADNAAHDIIEKNLGPKPDIKAEEEAIINKAHSLVSADYTSAHANPTKLSVYSLIGDINKEIETSVGKEKSTLQEVKGYLYKTTKDAVGNDVKTIKNSVLELHKVRQGIDDIINDRGDSLPPNALRAIQKVRDAVDAQLKTIPEMAAADAKFAEKMKIKEGLKIGYDSLLKGNIEEFKKTFDAASPELKDTIRKGLHAKIGDLMEQATSGELAQAQRLFRKRVATREKLTHAFGPAGDEVLDALAKQTVLRRTENLVETGSRTSYNTRINALLDNTGKSSGVVGEAIKGLAIDVATGSPAMAAGVMGARRLGGNIVNKAGEVRHDLNVESFADLISRSGADVRPSLKVVGRVDKILKGIEKTNVKIPEAAKNYKQILAPTIGGYIEDKTYQTYKKLRGE